MPQLPCPKPAIRLTKLLLIIRSPFAKRIDIFNSLGQQLLHCIYRYKTGTV